MTNETWVVAAIWAGAFVLALVGSGPFVRSVLRQAGKEVPPDEADPGPVIGKLEDVVVVALVAVGAYTALALIFAAKGIARVEGGREKASYYVLGTLANFTWALLVALAARLLVRWI